MVFLQYLSSSKYFIRYRKLDDTSPKIVIVLCNIVMQLFLKNKALSLLR
jgi:hypothetical protein